MAVVYSSNFDAATVGVIAPGWTAKIGTWLVSTTAPVSSPNSFGSSTNADGDVALYTGSSAIADMQIDFQQVAVDNLVGGVVRSDTGNANHYVALVSISGGTTYTVLLYKKVSGTYTQVGSTATGSIAYTAGTTIIFTRLKIVGTAITFFIGAGGLPGSASASFTDSSVSAAGYPGLYQNTPSGGKVDNLVFDDTASAGLTLTSPTASKVFQRSGTVGSIAIAGQHTDSVARSIEASFNGGSYVTIATSIAPSTPFTGVLAAQAQGAGTLTVRLVGNTGIASTVSVGVGELFLLVGQSNSVGQGTNNQVYRNATVSSSMFTAAYAWATIADPVGSTAGQTDSSLPDNSPGAGGSVWPLVAGRLASLLRVPVGFIQCSRDGCGLSYTTNVQSWLPIPTSHTDRTKLYGSAVYRAQINGGVKAALWWGGESDALGGRTQAQFTADLTTISNALFTDLGVQTLPCAFQHSSGVSDAAQALINNATISLWGVGHIKAGPDLRDLNSIDGFHLMTDDQLSTAADRWVSSLNAAFYTTGSGGGINGSAILGMA